MRVVTCQNQNETRRLAEKLSSSFQRPCLVLLTGSMGAGKTQFVRWMLESLGVMGTSSPTFAIHQQYSTNLGPIDHVDLYRVESDEDLESTGFWEMIQGPDVLAFIEWADRLPMESWPSGGQIRTIHLEKDSSGDDARRVNLTGFEPNLI